MIRGGRREFLAISAGALASCGTPSRGSSEVSIVDPHLHLWDLDKLRLPWLQSEGVAKIRRSYLMSDYRKATVNVPVDKTVDGMLQY